MLSGNGVISSFDAGMIAKYAAGPPYAPPGIGSTATWGFFTVANIFLPLGDTPTSRTYASVRSNIAGDDFTGILFGEVSGNWSNTGARPTNIHGPERDVIVELPKIEASSHEKIIVPVMVGSISNKEIISYEFDLNYDPTVIRPLEDPVDLAGTVSRGLGVVVNTNEPGLLRVVVYGPLSIDSDGVLLNLRFIAIGKAGSVSPITWERIIFNEGEPRISTTNGQVELF